MLHCHVYHPNQLGHIIGNNQQWLNLKRKKQLINRSINQSINRYLPESNSKNIEQLNIIIIVKAVYAIFVFFQSIILSKMISWFFWDQMLLMTKLEEIEHEWSMIVVALFDQSIDQSK